MPGLVCDRIEECDGWKKSYRQINGAVAYYQKHFGGPYTGAQFEWCPWCGKKITKEMWANRKIG